MTLAQIRSNDVVIDHLKVIAAKKDVDHIRRDMLLASWPRTQGSSWVFIRKVHAKTSTSRLALALSNQARSIMAQPRSPMDNSLVMRFDSFDTLLVCLLADLANGSASTRWYWQHWQYLFKLPVSRALGSLMKAHPEHLPSVTAGLANAGKLSNIWQRLDQEDAICLTEAVARRNGLLLKSIGVQDIFEEKMLSPLPKLPDQLRRRWEEVLPMLPMKDPRRRLALMLIGQEGFPLYMQKAPLSFLHALSKVFGEREPMFNEKTQEKMVPSEKTEKRAEILEEKRRENLKTTGMWRESESQNTQRFGQKLSDLTSHKAEEIEGDKDSGFSDFFEEDPKPGTLSGNERQDQERQVSPDKYARQQQKGPCPEQPSIAQAQNDAETIKTGPKKDDLIPQIRVHLKKSFLMKNPDSFNTTQGGLFFLLNFLKREDSQKLIIRHPSNDEFTSGWGWLYRLGQELALDEKDSVILFLVFQMGFKSVDQLKFLPPLPAREDLLALARKLYDHSGLWRPDLLRLNATVRYTPSHVDLYAPLSSVRLSVRLAGLDLNPGWLPWLGKVVTFHYEG